MESLISQGLSLMVFGMGFVFVFLTLLVFVTKIMSKMAMKFEPAAVPKATRRPAVASTPDVEKNNDEVLAVITAAVHQYRS